MKQKEGSSNKESPLILMYFSHGIGWTRSRNLDDMTRTRCLSYGILCSVPPKAKNRETEVSRGFRFFVSWFCRPLYNAATFFSSFVIARLMKSLIVMPVLRVLCLPPYNNPDSFQCPPQNPCATRQVSDLHMRSVPCSNPERFILESHNGISAVHLR